MDRKNKEILEFLEFIGLKGYEGKAYLALLSLGEATAPKISSKAGIPLPRIYDVLESLASKGLVEVKAGRPRIYKAVPPYIALNYYVRKYIEDILALNKRVIEELNRLYGSIKHEEPLIWLSSSHEMSIERTKDILNNMNIDGFMIVSEELLNKLANTLYKKLLSDQSIVFTATLTFRPSISRALEQLLYLNNIDIRILPTGIINAIETDLSSAVIFGKTYTLFTNEWELILLLNETFYHGYWRIAKRIKEFSITPNKQYKTAHHWLSIVLINDGMKLGYNAWVKIRGYRVIDKEPIEIEGYVKETRAHDLIRSLVVETKDGNRINVGGLGASVEDIEARYIEVVFT
ncbi:MAG: hypothetical protein DRO15_03090 [Thermoprotei archaeon]|nr:MAG: hypothetical protein DRO15_03090 [Thermoprotei archaeon]